MNLNSLLVLLTTNTALSWVLIVSMLRIDIAVADQSAKRDLAKQLANPIADLYTLPLQFNFDTRVGTDNKGSVYQLNAQPLIPFALNEYWNLISRTVLPLILQTDVTGGNQHQFGIGDTLQSLFLSPSAPTEQGFTWGVGPALLMPTATENSLGIKQWAMGATAVVLRQSGHLTIGILANHLWSLGDGSRAYTATYTEPWISYVFSSNTTLSMSVESSYDWNNDQLTLPVNIIVDQLFVIGEQAVSVGVGVKYWAASPAEGPQGFGARLQVTFLWPK